MEMLSSHMVLVSSTFIFWNKSKDEHCALCFSFLAHGSCYTRLYDGYIIFVFDPGSVCFVGEEDVNLGANWSKERGHNEDMKEHFKFDIRFIFQISNCK